MTARIPARRAARIPVRRWIPCALLLAACSGPPPPWDVKRGEEERFREARKNCRMLTDEPGGGFHAERFEACMNRRGWHRKNLVTRVIDQISP